MNRAGKAMKVAGIASFTFFFVKGLAWLAILGGAAVAALMR